MSNLGKCLLFYLKYRVEMERLYEAEEPNVEGLPNPDRNLQRIKWVGDVAYEEAVELLEDCAPGIEKYFGAISAVQRIRTKLENTWDLRFRVKPKRARRWRFEIGIAIDPYRTALIPWVWCSGARRTEDEIVRILDRGIRAATLKYNAGTVGLLEIQIPIPERLDEPVASDSLLTQVQQAFAPFTAQKVRAIAAISS